MAAILMLLIKGVDTETIDTLICISVDIFYILTIVAILLSSVRIVVYGT